MEQEEIVEEINIGISVDSIDQIKRYFDTNSALVVRNIKDNVAGDKMPNMPFAFGDTRTRLRLTVPPVVHNTAHNEVRQSLPIYKYRENILNAISNNQVCVISAETGGGKTTQVPQYILEDSTARSRMCRIICTQPRRLAAISIATRVARERYENVGTAVGYQIRLDNRVRAETNLIFTTSGYLLRNLCGSKNNDTYENVTHLILDEVHEREKITDFLLIVIRDILKDHPRLKVILMSATIDSDMFSAYFGECPVINVPGRMFDVKVHHLAEILTMLNYNTDKMANDNRADEPPREPESESESTKDIEFFDEFLNNCAIQFESETASNNEFDRIFSLISDKNMPVDYMHSQTGRTAMSIAAEFGLLLTTKTFLLQGANPNLPDMNGKTPLDYAKENVHVDCFGLMRRFMDLETANEPMTKEEASATAKKDENDELQKNTLAAYMSSLMYPNDIDHKLLFRLISHLHRETPRAGSILVFLPGIEDILEQKDMIELEIKDSGYELFVLHSGVSSEQNRVFDQMPPEIRKIILSTNIAETSVTINDVIYVIDAGKVKQQTCNAGLACLQSTLISKACAKQRTGRAGRVQNGFCYRLYSLENYERMEMYTVPEILRVPLSEICLSARLLTNDGETIEQFLSKALQPPSSNNILQAIHLLQQIGALDPNERITHLGVHLANMPVDCQIGKSIMYAVLMQCLNPVITIGSAQSVKDPFLLPVNKDSASIVDIKNEFSDNSLSDHYMLLNAFNQWRSKKNEDREFCRKKMISDSNMQMIAAVRRLIIGHLQMTGIVREDSPTNNSRYLNRNSERWDIIKACLTAGSYPNICRVQQLTGELVSEQYTELCPHKSSILCDQLSKNKIDDRVLQTNANWLIHGEMSRVGKNVMIRTITPVPSIDLVLFAGPIILSEAHVIEGTVETVFRFDWIRISMRTEEAQLLLQLRQQFSTILVELFEKPMSFFIDQRKKPVIDLIHDVIEREDFLERFINEMRERKNHQLIIQLNGAANIQSGRVRINPKASLSRLINKGAENEIEFMSDGTGRLFLNDVDATYMVSISINDGVNSSLAGNICIDGSEKCIKFNDLFWLDRCGFIDRRFNPFIDPSLNFSSVLHLELIGKNNHIITVQSTYVYPASLIELNFNENGLKVDVKPK